MTDTAIRQFSSLDARVVLALIGNNKNQAQSLLWEIRRQVAMQGVTNSKTWQELWNTATGAVLGHPGELRFHASVTCTNCNGRRIDMRIGIVCHACMGRGTTNQMLRFTAVYAPVPADPCATDDRA